MKISKFHIPRSPEEALPPIGAFGHDDFHRARYYSAVIEKYAKKAETEELIKFARERRVVGMSFADTIESMARFIHERPIDGVERMLVNARKPKEQIEREVTFAMTVRQAMMVYGHQQGIAGPDVFAAMVESLEALFPGATRERIVGALESGNGPEGFSAARVIETMTLTEPPKSETRIG